MRIITGREGSTVTAFPGQKYVSSPAEDRNLLLFCGSYSIM